MRLKLLFAMLEAKEKAGGCGLVVDKMLLDGDMQDCFPLHDDAARQAAVFSDAAAEPVPEAAVLFEPTEMERFPFKSPSLDAPLKYLAVAASLVVTCHCAQKMPAPPGSGARAMWSGDAARQPSPPSRSAAA